MCIHTKRIDLTFQRLLLFYLALKLMKFLFYNQKEQKVQLTLHCSEKNWMVETLVSS